MARTVRMKEPELVGVLEDAARKGDVKVAQWLLERQWPEKWGALYARGKKVSDDGDGAIKDAFSELDQLAPRRDRRTAG